MARGGGQEQRTRRSSRGSETRSRRRGLPPASSKRDLRGSASMSLPDGSGTGEYRRGGGPRQHGQRRAGSSRSRTTPPPFLPWTVLLTALRLPRDMNVSQYAVVTRMRWRNWRRPSAGRGGGPDWRAGRRSPAGLRPRRERGGRTGSVRPPTCARQLPYAVSSSRFRCSSSSSRPRLPPSQAGSSMSGVRLIVKVKMEAGRTGSAATTRVGSTDSPWSD